jgi:hypothetical protein
MDSGLRAVLFGSGEPTRLRPTAPVRVGIVESGTIRDCPKILATAKTSGDNSPQRVFCSRFIHFTLRHAPCERRRPYLGAEEIGQLFH